MTRSHAATSLRTFSSFTILAIPILIPTGALVLACGTDAARPGSAADAGADAPASPPDSSATDAGAGTGPDAADASAMDSSDADAGVDAGPAGDANATEFSPPNVIPHAIASGPDGNLWFTAYAPNPGDDLIGKITTAGVVTTYPLPGAANGGTDGFEITPGPDGNLWFSHGSSHGGPNEVGKIRRRAPSPRSRSPP